MINQQLPVAIIGGGPVGMAAAAHLIKRNLPFILFESGESVGANILDWGHVRVFSPWKYNIDKAAEELLLQTNWLSPNKEQVHTGKEFIDDYLFPLSQHPKIKPFVQLNSRVISVGRKNMDKMKTKDRELQPFVLHVQMTDEIKWFEASAVIDATGTWQHPNPIGSGGIFAIGEIEHHNHIFYGFSFGLYTWIIARSMWAFCFSVLRTSSIHYALDAPKKGFGFGVSRSLQEIGPLISLLFGSLLLTVFSVQFTFLLLAIISMLSVFLSFKLTNIKVDVFPTHFKFKWSPTSTNGLIFLSSLIVEGLTVVLLNKLLITTSISTIELAGLVAFYLAMRRFLIIVLSPIAGFLSDYFGAPNLFNISIVGTVISLLFITLGFTESGNIFGFIFNGIFFQFPIKRNNKRIPLMVIFS